MYRFVLISLIAIFVSACGATLTPRGEAVKYVTKQEAPENCGEARDVSIGETAFEFDTAINVSDAKTRLRNKAGETGSNYLVIDTIEAHQNPQGGRYYSATGRAYVCPE